MSEIEVKIRDDKAMLYTPYNPEFVKRIKKFSDLWGISWESARRVWDRSCNRQYWLCCLEAGKRTLIKKNQRKLIIC